MRYTRTAAACLLVVLITAGTDAAAQRTEQAFTASGRSCGDITWQPDVLARFPDIDDACQEVVTYDGRTFVRFIGTVDSVSGGGRTMNIHFEGTDEAIALDTPENMQLFVDGRRTPVRRLQRGDELTFHVPADQFVAHFFEPGSQTQFVTARIVRVTPVQQAGSTQSAGSLPATASMLPRLALLGALFVMAGGVLMMARILARR